MAFERTGNMITLIIKYSFTNHRHVLQSFFNYFGDQWLYKWSFPGRTNRVSGYCDKRKIDKVNSLYQPYNQLFCKTMWQVVVVLYELFDTWKMSQLFWWSNHRTHVTNTRHTLRNCPEANAIDEANISQVNGVVPSNDMPLPELLFTYTYVAIWHH